MAEGLLIGGAGGGKREQGSGGKGTMKRSVVESVDLVMDEDGSPTSLEKHYNNRKAARQERSAVYRYLETAFEK